MSKLVIVLVIAAVVCVNARPEPEPEPFSVPDFWSDSFSDFGSHFKIPSFPNLPSLPVPVLSPDDIKSLKGDKNTHVSGHYQSSSSSFKSVNGVPVENKQSGREITNDDGDVTDQKY